jgi:hypothetical protein
VEQARLWKTVNDFVTGYCDALGQVDMLGDREVVDISSDEDDEHNTTVQHEETDESSFLSAVSNWANVQVKCNHTHTCIFIILLC